MSLVYNERSWAIDLISEINSIVKGKNLEIARASGEAGLKNVKGFLFPDAIIYGSNANVIMGWELKMPDTPIEDSEFFENASKKANLLGTNSFLLWNGKYAKLYSRKGEDFQELKSWHDVRLIDRKSMDLHREYWIELLKQILQDLEFYISSGEIPALKIAKVLNDNFIIEVVNALFQEDAKRIKEEYQSSSAFRIDLDIWGHENGFEKSEERFSELAKINLLSWINRLIFSHYLATKNPRARSIFNIKSGTSVEEALSIFDQITRELDFSQIYKPGIGNSLISDRGWTGRVEVNEFLVSANLLELPEDIFRKVLDNFAESSKRKGMGQYATPNMLARLLVRLTIDNARGSFFDPCVGSGTFVKEAFSFKKELGIAPSEAFNTLWASDKYQIPLQITTLNLLDEDVQDIPLKIFKSDVFDLEIDQEVELVNPTDLTQVVSVSRPLMNSIVSNLPFIRFESSKSRGPAEVAKEVFDLTGSNEAKKLGKADIYATIIFQLWHQLVENGRLGVVVSNSWMGTDWGKSFQELIEPFFTLETVIRSGNRRWFDNADVITTLLILRKKTQADADSDKAVKFVTTQIALQDWNNQIVNEFITNIARSETSEILRVNSINLEERKRNQSAGYSIRSNFYKCDWVSDFVKNSVPVSNLFEVARGARRGWNPLFYPDNPSKIESEFLIPALKSTSKQTYLVANPDSVAFCCEESIEELVKSEKSGALAWVRNFENQVNNKGLPLPEVLGQPDFFWYQMSSKEKANFVISMNPYENLSVLQLKPAAFVDQRLIRINPLATSNEDLELLHALLNCTLSLTGIELLGFERGLGVLDISSTSLRKYFRILDPALIGEDQRKEILSTFSKVKGRTMKKTMEEIEMSDRQAFDSAVLKAFGMESYQSRIYEVLSTSIRERVNY